MRSSAILTAALFAFASAFPTPQGDQPGENVDAEFALTQIGTGVITPYCQRHPYDRTPCPAVLDTGNVLITGVANNVNSDEADKSEGIKKAFSFGFLGGDGKYATITSLAVFKNLPEIARGKQCKFHFITDGGSNPVSQPKALIYSLKGAPVTDQSTWNNKPQREAVVASFILNDALATNLGPDGGYKKDHKFIGGPGWTMGESFPCPTPGFDYAWEIVPEYVPSGDTSPMFTGGQNGLGLEILDTPQTGYLPGTVTSPAPQNPAPTCSSPAK